MDIPLIIPEQYYPTSPKGSRAGEILSDCLLQLNRSRPNLVSRASLSRTRNKAVFRIPFAFYPGALETVNARALQTLMTCLTDLDVDFLIRNPNARLLADSTVVYARTLEWDTLPALFLRGYGDCKSLTAARCAEYKRVGRECRPVFRFIKRSTGALDFHILVQTGAGFEDPSKEHGMGSNENAHF